MPTNNNLSIQAHYKTKKNILKRMRYIQLIIDTIKALTGILSNNVTEYVEKFINVFLTFENSNRIYFALYCFHSMYYNCILSLISERSASTPDV